MNRKHGWIILIVLILLLLSQLACGYSGGTNPYGPDLVTYPDGDGGTCYSTLQPGCLDALMGWDE